MIYWRKVQQGCLGGRNDLLEEGRKVEQGCLGGRNDILEEGRKVEQGYLSGIMIYWRKVEGRAGMFE